MIPAANVMMPHAPYEIMLLPMIVFVGLAWLALTIGGQK
jgi:hypothetical protein